MTRRRLRVPLSVPRRSPARFKCTWCVGWAMRFFETGFTRFAGEERGTRRTCGYNLTGNVSGVCPECGEAI